MASTAHNEHFHQEKAAVLAASWAASSDVGVDDTGARHQGQNGSCIALGNDRFADVESTASKSRLNFRVHAACWMHAERPLAKRVPHNEEHRAAIAQVRSHSREMYRP